MSPKQKKTSCEAPTHYSSPAVCVNASPLRGMRLQTNGTTDEMGRAEGHRKTPTARSAQTRAGGEELAPGAARPRRLGGPTLGTGPLTYYYPHYRELLTSAAMTFLGMATTGASLEIP